MRQLKMLILAVLAMFAFGAVVTAVASAEEAEEKNNPRLLILSGNVSELNFHGEGEGSTLSILKSEKLIEGNKVLVLLKGCLELEKKPLDTNLCHEGEIDFTGVKIAGTATTCRSENLLSEKDPVETVLAKLETHLAAEESTEKVLQPLLVSIVLGTDGTLASAHDLEIVCGLVKILVTGRIGCLLLPGLTQIAANGKVEVLCKTDLTNNVPNGDQLTGTCTVTTLLCKELAENPFSAAIIPAAHEMAAMLLHINKGTFFNKDVYIDD
jgi:hypothetical protein